MARAIAEPMVIEVAASGFFRTTETQSSGATRELVTCGDGRSRDSRLHRQPDSPDGSDVLFKLLMRFR